MKDHDKIPWPLLLSAMMAPLVLMLPGCAGRQAVYASTGTTLGVEISQDPSTQLYQAKLGYNRAELAVVPSNRSAKKEPGNQGGGARDTTDVLMELRYAGIFSLGADSGIYQRLAVGSNAVAQPGAAFMFAKNTAGHLEPSVAEAVKQSVLTIPEAKKDIERSKVPLATAFEKHKTDPQKKALFDQAIQPKYSSFEQFLIDANTPPDFINQVSQTLKQQQLLNAQ